jgi:hypothetical protein
MDEGNPRSTELYEELDEDYKQKAFALRDELIRNKEAHRLKVLRTCSKASDCRGIVRTARKLIVCGIEYPFRCF